MGEMQLVQSLHTRQRLFLTSIISYSSLVTSMLSSSVTPVDLKDDRLAKASGFDLIYEARDLDLPQNIRDGLTQSRGSLTETKNRVSESKLRFAVEVLPSLKKSYWTKAKEALRLQIGTLRMDLKTLSEALPLVDKEPALAIKATFWSEIESLDFYMRQKDLEASLSTYKAALTSLDSLLTFLL